MDKSSKLILVVGAAGYLGSVLVRKLLARGYRVRGLDCFMYDNAFSLADLESDDRFEIIKGDFCDEAVLSVALDGVSDLMGSHHHGCERFAFAYAGRQTDDFFRRVVVGTGIRHLHSNFA